MYDKIRMVLIIVKENSEIYKGMLGQGDFFNATA